MTRKSIWWAIRAAFWYRWDYGIPLFFCKGYGWSAWFHAFTLRATYNSEPQLSDETCQQETPREAVANDVSYWEE